MQLSFIQTAQCAIIHRPNLLRHICMYNRQLQYKQDSSLENVLFCIICYDNIFCGSLQNKNKIRYIIPINWSSHNRFYSFIKGNGPSGICLSFMLSGHWPYWNADRVQTHPDELLRARLNYVDENKSLVLQDLLMLADGLEGRSTNPVSLLLDSLQNPCADIGMELPSMLTYKYHPEKQVMASSFFPIINYIVTEF